MERRTAITAAFLLDAFCCMFARCYSYVMKTTYESFLKVPRPCPFCSLKEGIIAENAHAYLTYALAPYHPDHLLIIPKRHILNLLDVSAAEEDDIYELVRTALRALHASGYVDVSVLVREGDNSMKTVEHMHYNVIPNTRLGDIDHLGQKRVLLTPAEAAVETEKIQKLI